MSDLRIVYIQDVLPLIKVSEVTGSSPRQLELVGSNFLSAAEVWINHHPAASFTIQSKARIRAVVPDCVGDDDITDVGVLSYSFTNNGSRSKISMQLGNKPQNISGLFRLTQRFVKLLLRNPGSDIAQPAYGGGLGALVTQFLQGGKEINAADIALAVGRAERQLRRIQATNSYLRDSERLASATLLGVELSYATGMLVPKIQLISQAGVSAATELEM